MKPRPLAQRRKSNIANRSLQPYSSGRPGQRIVIILWFLAWGTIAGLALFWVGAFTLGGIPGSIAFKFLSDPQAVSLFLQGQKKQLHDRLEARGFEEDIKAYYRPQFSDEQELDRYIHQLLYDRTGYIGRDYTLVGKGVLVLKRSRRP